LDEFELHTMAVRPLIPGSAGELGTLVRSYGLRIATELRRPIQNSRHIQTWDRDIGDDVDGLLRAVVDDRQSFDTASVG
jgi:hypothetical protein